MASCTPPPPACILHDELVHATPHSQHPACSPRGLILPCWLAGPAQLAAELPEAVLDSTPADQHIVELLRRHQQAQRQLQAVAQQVESVSRSASASASCACPMPPTATEEKTRKCTPFHLVCSCLLKLAARSSQPGSQDVQHFIRKLWLPAGIGMQHDRSPHQAQLNDPTADHACMRLAVLAASCALLA